LSVLAVQLISTLVALFATADLMEGVVGGCVSAGGADATVTVADAVAVELPFDAVNL
jgi:hypothetical protein